MTTRHLPTLAAVLILTLAVACASKENLQQALRITALDDSAWQSAQWISVADAPVVSGPVDDHQNGRAADGASWFVSDVNNEKRIVQARWMTTALGVYELYVNGRPVGEEVLKPGFTHHAKTRRSFTYDITPLIRRKAGDRRRHGAFRGVLELTYADGTHRYVGTDTEHWRAAIGGPVLHAAIFDGEQYDARQQPGYASPRLSVPEVNHEFQGDILPSEGAEVYLRRDLALRPARAYVWQGVTAAHEGEFGKVVITREFSPGQTMTIFPGETLVVDFGQNCAAVPSFTFKAAEGTVLTCLPAELLNDGNGARSRGMDGPEGSVHRDNLRIPRTGMRLDYTFANTGADFATFLPTSTFFGYRYVSITATSEVTIQKIESVPVTSIARHLETGTITTGNDLVNRLISNTLWGQRSNYLSIPTDCPQRNERLGWTADTQVFAETGTFFANTRQFFHKWMRDMRDSQNEHGGFPGVAPDGQYGGECMRLGWADAGIIVPWTVWKQFADTDIVDENWEAMNRFMTHIYQTKYDHEALRAENGNYQWADWLSYEPLESCGGGAFNSSGPLPDAVSYWRYLGACYWAIDADMMADMAEATGRNASPYRQMASEARQYLKEQFLNADGTFRVSILNTMQTPALFALRNHLVDGQAKSDIIARLRQNFADHGNCLQTGFLGTSILMPTLTDNGMTDIAFELLFQRRNPSWLYSVDNGATTIWERWNSYMLDRGMGPQGMNSFNHYAYGVVCQWLWESVAGIAADPAAPGFRHIIMRPTPDKRLQHVEASYQSAAGLIKSAWRYEGDRWTWQFTIPKGATATVTLPGETESKEYSSGTHKIVVQ